MQEDNYVPALRDEDESGIFQLKLVFKPRNTAGDVTSSPESLTQFNATNPAVAFLKAQNVQTRSPENCSST